MLWHFILVAQPTVPFGCWTYSAILQTLFVCIWLLNLQCHCCALRIAGRHDVAKQHTAHYIEIPPRKHQRTLFIHPGSDSGYAFLRGWGWHPHHLQWWPSRKRSSRHARPNKAQKARQACQTEQAGRGASRHARPNEAQKARQACQTEQAGRGASRHARPKKTQKARPHRGRPSRPRRHARPKQTRHCQAMPMQHNSNVNEWQWQHCPCSAMNDIPISNNKA